MPLYDYECAACGRTFEVIHGVHADSPAACPLCGGGPVRKAITAAAIHYKGSGWAKKERRTAPASATSKSSADGGDKASADRGEKDSADGGDTSRTDGGDAKASEGHAPEPSGSSAKTETPKEARSAASTQD
jgi:putative FmdB family regulatory protein